MELRNSGIFICGQVVRHSLQIHWIGDNVPIVRDTHCNGVDGLLERPGVFVLK